MEILTPKEREAQENRLSIGLRRAVRAKAMDRVRRLGFLVCHLTIDKRQSTRR